MQLAHTIVGGERAPLVVLLHGFLGSGNDWRATVDALAPRRRCLTVDLPGHGGSTGGNDADYTIPSAATAIIDLIDTLDAPSFSLVGYSMGGRLALFLASVYAMRIDALVIESASPGLRTEPERAERRAHDERWARMLDSEGMGPFLDAWYRQPLFAPLASRPDLLESLVARRREQDPHELARALRGMGVGRQQPLWDEWRTNHVPALAIAGERDAKYCAIVHEMTETCPAAISSIVPGVGHNVHEEAPDEYNLRIVEFLGEGMGCRV